MNILRQTIIVSSLSLRSLKNRLWLSLVIVASMACVAGVLLSLLSMAEGMSQAHTRTGDPRDAIAVAQGTDFEVASSIPREKAQIVLAAPGIARAADGSPIAEAGVMVSVPGNLKKNGAKAFVLLRGMGEKGLTFPPNFHLVEGRMFRPGTRELIVGTRARTQYKNMAVGDKVILPDGEWPIVGAFASGDLSDGQLLGDTDTLMPGLRRTDYNSVVVRLASPGAFAAFRAALANPALRLDVMRLPDWNRKNGNTLVTFEHNLAYGVGVILGLGALFGCFNTMYAAVGSRAQETATLRALGYSGFAVAVSVLLEAGLLSAAGALIGAVIAWALYDGVQSSAASDVFTLSVSPVLFGTAILWALAVAFLGGFFPSLQAARSTVADALRAR